MESGKKSKNLESNADSNRLPRSLATSRNDKIIKFIKDYSKNEILESREVHTRLLRFESLAMTELRF